MDLASVKAAVKAWEKAFKLREGRDPNKDDIKKDPGDIAEQYTLYRKLVKAGGSSSSQSQSQRSSKSQSSQSLRPPSSITTSAAPSSSSSSHYRSDFTPKHIPSSEYPTTPTPPSRSQLRARSHRHRRSSEVEVESHAASNINPSNSAAGPSRLIFQSDTKAGNGIGTASASNANAEKSLKRKASQVTLRDADSGSFSRSPSPPLFPQPSASTSTSTARTLFTTPKKKGYTGPVHDPNPVNPFAISTPTKSSPNKSPFIVAVAVSGNPSEGRSQSFSSPFIHASSPRKLKEVLEANSLRKVKERENGGLGQGIHEITPRTRARKRLRGEPVDDTPIKDKVPRRRRGQGESLGKGGSSAAGLDSEPDYLSVRGGVGMIEEDEHEDEDEEEEGEGLGPSPMKGLDRGKGFTSLFGELEAVSSTSKSKGGSREPSNVSSASKQNGSFITSNAVAEKNKNAKGKQKNGSQARVEGASRGRGTNEGMFGLFGRIGKSTLPSRVKADNSETPDEAAATPTSSSQVIPTIGIQVQASPSPPPARASSVTEQKSITTGSVPTPPPPLPTSIPPTAIPEADLISPPVDLDEVPLPRSQRQSHEQRKKVLSLSDDEMDEWDPEGGTVRREVVIVPTRRAVRRRGGSSDLESASENEGGSVTAVRVNGNTRDHDGYGVEDEDDAGDDSESSKTGLKGDRGAEDSYQDQAQSPSHTPVRTNGKQTNSDPNSLPLSSSLSLPTPIPMLSLLSLRSPNSSKSRQQQKRAQLEELRVKAIFDPSAQSRLKALQRGQEVVFTGDAREAEEEDGDEGLLGRYEMGSGVGDADDVSPGGGFGTGTGIGEEGDDDWEEEDDGWKREQDDEDW